MWFKNASLFTLTDFAIPADALAAALARRAFAPCTDLEDKTSGFIAPMPDGVLVYALEGQYLLALRTEKKVLPPAVVREEVARRAAKYEQEYGHKAGRKMMRTIKDEAYYALLPKAFATSKVTHAWIDTKAGLMVIDTASQAAADHFIGNFIRAIETQLKLAPLRTVTTTDAGMTQWVADEAPSSFTVDQDAVFAGRKKDTIKFSNTSLDNVAQQQIQDGRRVTSLAMTWDEKVSFVLSPNCVLRRLKALDVLTSDKGERDVAEDVAAADFLLMTGTLTQLITDITESLDGIREPEADLTDEEPRAQSDDPLYEEAVRIVRSNDRASISLVQRHLRIGYNRAAALLEEMEHAGVVSVMNSNGSRTVLKELA